MAGFDSVPSGKLLGFEANGARLKKRDGRYKIVPRRDGERPRLADLKIGHYKTFAKPRPCQDA